MVEYLIFNIAFYNLIRNKNLIRLKSLWFSKNIGEKMSAEKFAGIMEFIQVVERGSFTSASNILGVSKSHISKQVTQLEDRLKTRLIQRSTRKLRLTDEGEHYYKHCSLAITDLENVAMELGQHRQTPKGILKISTPVTLGEFFISSLLADFVAKHTDLQVEFNMSTENVQLIDDGYDLAIRIGHLEDSSLIARPLANIEFCALLDYGLFSSLR